MILFTMVFSKVMPKFENEVRREGTFLNNCLITNILTTKITKKKTEFKSQKTEFRR